MDDFHTTEMIVAGPIIEAYEEVRRELEETRELHPASPTILPLARTERLLREKIKQARTAEPTCDTERAAEIMGVTPRQARNIARDELVKAWKRGGGRWIFSVRSCYAYAEMRGREWRAA